MKHSQLHNLPPLPQTCFTKMTYKTPEKRFTPSACKPTRPQNNIRLSGGTDYVAYPSSNPTFRKTTMSFINTKDFKKEQPIYNRKTSHHNLLCLPLVISIVVTLFFLWMNHFFLFFTSFCSFAKARVILAFCFFLLNFKWLLHWKRLVIIIPCIDNIFPCSCIDHCKCRESRFTCGN